MVFWFFKSKEGKVHKKVEDMHSSVTNSFNKIKDDILNISNWIKHFDSKNTDHDKKIDYILKKLGRIENLVELKHIKHEKDIDEVDTIEHVQSFNRSDQSFMNVQSLKKLTPAQKQIVALLSYSKDPMGYDDMSKKLKLSVVTVRRHLNDVKRGGIPINEKRSVKSRKKVFYMEKKIKILILKSK